MSRILFLAANLCSGGAERQMVTVACLLRERGHDVTVYCYDSADFYADILRRANIPIVWELTPKSYLKRIIKVRSFIRRGKFDAVISFLRTPNFLNNVAAIGGRKWHVITGERSAKEDFFKTKKGKVFGWFQRFGDTIVCNSYNARNMWEKYYPEYKSKLEVVYNYVQLGPINTEYKPKKNNKLHIVIAATYQYLKNPIGLAKAISMMSEKEKELVRIEWYGRKEIARGDCRAYNDTVTIVNKNGLTNVLRLHEDTKDISNIMFQADAVMLLSEFEGLPNVICEAMSMGKPIIMTKVSDYTVLVDKSNGLLCDWDNPESIKESILELADRDCEQLKNMGNASKKKADKLFSKDVIIQGWEKVICGIH